MTYAISRHVMRSACAALLATVLAACQKGGRGAEAPARAPAAPAAPGALGESGAGQYAISDRPSSGKAAERPKMNAAAAQAYSAGLAAFRSGEIEGARTQFTKATQADSRAYQAYYSLGVVRERLGETSGALSAYQQAVSILPDYEPAISAYGVLLARTGKADEAAGFLEQKQGQLPKSAAVTAALAEVKSIQGDSGSAQRLAQEALKKNPDYRPAMVTLARDHYRARRLDLALYTLKGILDGYGTENPPRDKNNAEARLIRGLILKEQGQRGPAIDDFKRAIEARPDLVEARVQLATYYLESGNATDATPLLEGALRYDKNNVLARMNLGDAYRLLGKTAEAKQQLEWVAGKDPTLAQIHYNLGLLFLFSYTNVPGMTPAQALTKAVGEFEEFKKMKPRAGGGVPDDTDELIARAKTQKALLEAKQSEKTAATAAPASKPAAAQPATATATPPKTAPATPAKSGSASGALPPAGAGATAKPGSSTGSLPPPPGGK